MLFSGVVKRALTMQRIRAVKRGRTTQRTRVAERDGADLVFGLEMLEDGLEAIGEIGHYAIYAGEDQAAHLIGLVGGPGGYLQIGLMGFGD